MNISPTIRDALLVRRMEYWLLRARHGPIGNCPACLGRKNYLFTCEEVQDLGGAARTPGDRCVLRFDPKERRST